jgi:hypothetical protein
MGCVQQNANCQVKALSTCLGGCDCDIQFWVCSGLSEMIIYMVIVQ